MPPSEAAYQQKLVKKIEKLFPGCYVFKNDPEQRQGIPDLLILIRDRWLMLEVKRSKSAPKQPNQDYYLARFGEMSYASYVYPENEKEVFNDIQRVLEEY